MFVALGVLKLVDLVRGSALGAVIKKHSVVSNAPTVTAPLPNNIMPRCPSSREPLHYSKGTQEDCIEYIEMRCLEYPFEVISDTLGAISLCGVRCHMRQGRK